MPRAGTTLLANLLGQNPACEVTPTSGLIHLMLSALQRWPEVVEFQSQGLQTVKPQVQSAIKGLLLGFHEQSLAQGKFVFDKSRGWLDYLEPLEVILGAPTQCIVLVRDVRGVVGSFEKLYRRRGIEWKYPQGEKYAKSLSVEQRARWVLNQDQVVGRSIVRLRDAMTRCGDQLAIIPYRQFTIAPQETMAKAAKFLGLPTFDYDPTNVKQITHEDDNIVGMDLHRIRSKIEPQAEEPWNGVLPESLADELAETYADINRLAAGPVVCGVQADSAPNSTA